MVLVDTNVLISAALLAGSVPARLVRHLLQHGCIGGRQGIAMIVEV